MEQLEPSGQRLKFTFKTWILYPAISGSMFAMGSFTIFYLSIQLLKQKWFVSALKNLAIEFENKIK